MKTNLPIKIKVIIGSTRQGRFGEKPARWIYDTAKQKPGVEAELLDLRDYPMPFFNEPTSPAAAKGNHSNDIVKKWAEKIKDGDAFITTVAEYNHGYTAVLKNALDSVYQEWNRKPIGFVGYGSALGARAMEQLRQVAVELQMAPIRSAIHIPGDIYRAIANQPTPVDQELFKPLANRADAFLNDLMWWATALKNAREGV